MLGLNGKRVRLGVIVTTARRAYAHPGVFHGPYVSRRRAKAAPAASLDLIIGSVGSRALSSAMPWSGIASDEI